MTREHSRPLVHRRGPGGSRCRRPGHGGGHGGHGATAALVLGDGDGDPVEKLRALDAEVEASVVTREELAVLAAALLRSREVYPE